jgi:hypothetical protein
MMLSFESCVMCGELTQHFFNYSELKHNISLSLNFDRKSINEKQELTLDD